MAVVPPSWLGETILYKSSTSMDMSQQSFRELVEQVLMEKEKEKYDREMARMGKRVLVLSLLPKDESDHWHKFFQEIYSAHPVTVFIRQIGSLDQIIHYAQAGTQPFTADYVHAVYSGESQISSKLVDLFLAIWVPGKRASDVIWQPA